MTNENPELKKQQSISAAEHPKAWDPQVMILGLPLAVVGCIIGLELIVRTGVTPNTSIIGALFAILERRMANSAPMMEHCLPFFFPEFRWHF